MSQVPDHLPQEVQINVKLRFLARVGRVRVLTDEDVAKCCGDVKRMLKDEGLEVVSCEGSVIVDVGEPEDNRDNRPAR